MRTFIRGLMLMAIAVGARSGPLPASAAPASGHTYTVNSTLDEPAVNPASGVCASTPSGRCTLRAAIMASNVVSGPNTILLPAGSYTLTRPGQDDGALNGDLDIAQDLTLHGAGAGSTIVNGNGAVTGDRVFQVLYTAQSVTLSGLTIQNGRALAANLPNNDDGGGLYMLGTAHLILDHVVIAGNQANVGGGLYVDYDGYQYPASKLEVRDSQIYGNTAEAGGGMVLFGDANFAGAQIARSQIFSNTASQNSGGGIYDYVPLALTDSWVHDNHASVWGGGIAAFRSLTVTGTTFSANVADDGGGGLYFADLVSGERLILTNSTLSGNTAHKYGGGLYQNGSRASLFNTTIASNLVQHGLPIQSALGGGLYLTGTATFNAKNSIVANNLVRTTGVLLNQPDDCASQASVGSLNYSLMTTTAHCTIIPSLFGTGDLFGQDPHLGPLQNNGGPTLTQALLSNSPAINAGDPAGCDGPSTFLLTDQRGASRSDGHFDIGAYEVVP